MIKDGHVHAYGQYLNNELIHQYLNQDKTDYMVLIAGELESKKIYKIKDKTIDKPNHDYISSMYNLIKIRATLTHVA